MIEIMLINALFINGLYIATEPSMILGFVSRIPMPDWLAKPLYACVWCMASIWSIPFVFYAHMEIVDWLLYVPALSASAGLIYSVIDKLTNKRDSGATQVKGLKNE